MKKRLFDITLSSVGLVLASVPMFALFVLSRAQNGGKGFFLHERVGKDLKTFDVYKIQSLREEFNGQSSFLTTSNHVTPLFDSIRRRGLDELPQFINILKGEMSFVGPRPIPPNEYEKTKPPVGTYKVRPGITSPYVVWSLSEGRNDDSVKQRLDLEYAQAPFSIRKDLGILARTFLPAVLGKSPQTYDAKTSEDILPEAPEETKDLG